MRKEIDIEMEGVVIKQQSGNDFIVKITFENGLEQEIQGILSGKMKMHNIRIIPGDSVNVVISPYDLTKGRIVFRNK